MVSNEERRRRAREIAEARYGFRWHLVIYLIVNGGLVAIWAASDRSFPWPLFPIFFWGLGLVAHYVGAYQTGLGARWIERETDRILQEQQTGKGGS